MELDLVLSTWTALVELFKGDNVDTAIKLIAVIGAIDRVIVILKKIKGRKVSSVKHLENNRVVIVVGDDRMEIEGDVYEICKSSQIQKAIKKLIHDPLTRDGITEFKSKSEDLEIIVSKDQAEYFSSVSFSEEEAVEDLSKKVLVIESVSFKSDNKWRFFDGSSTIYATITDLDFLNKIEEREIAFSKGDMLVCNMRTTQRLNDNGDLKATYAIEHVIDCTHQIEISEE